MGTSRIVGLGSRPHRLHVVLLILVLGGAMLLVSPAVRPATAATSPTVYTGSARLATGSLTDIYGSGWPAGRSVYIYLGTQLWESPPADDDGEFYLRSYVPVTTLPGPTPLVANEPISQTTASTSVTVRTDWAQDGFGPSHAGVNASEVLVGPSNAATLARKWSAPLATNDGGPSRVLVTGSTFNIVLVRERTTLSALRTADGSVLWRKTVPGSWPVVAAGNERVFMLTSTGEVRALSLVDGATAWQQNLGEGASVKAVSATYDDGADYDAKPRLVVTLNTPSSGGRVVAFNPADGRLLWKRATTSNVGGAAVHDGWVYFGTDQGKAVALYLLYGSIRWSTQTKAYALGQPAVSDKTVVFGASTTEDDAGYQGQTGPVGLYAFDEGTGAQRWAYESGYGLGLVTRPAVASGVVYAGLAEVGDGASANAVKAFTLSSGAVRWSFSAANTAGGQGWTDPAVANGVVYVGSCGPNQKFLALGASGGAKLRDYNPNRCSTAAPVNARVYLGGRDTVEALGLPVEIPPTATINDAALGEGSERLGYSAGWQVGKNGSTYGGDDHYTATAGRTVTTRFTGIGLRYWFSTAPYHGIAAVSIDGGPETRVDLYRSERRDKQAVWTSPVLTRGEHRITIRATGTRNPSSSGSTITVDRIDFGH